MKVNPIMPVQRINWNKNKERGEPNEVRRKSVQKNKSRQSYSSVQQTRSGHINIQC